VRSYIAPDSLDVCTECTEYSEEGGRERMRVNGSLNGSPSFAAARVARREGGVSRSGGGGVDDGRKRVRLSSNSSDSTHSLGLSFNSTHSTTA
jgi:hypothetical protein